MPAGDLKRYWQVLQRLQHRMELGGRADRFKPPEAFVLARVQIGDRQAASVTGEIVDISAEGMKLALQGGISVAVDQFCHLDIGVDGQDCFELEGLVRWVDSHPLITVIGIQLKSAELRHGPPA